MQPMNNLIQLTGPNTLHNEIETQVMIVSCLAIGLNIFAVACLILVISRLFYLAWKAEVTDKGIVLSTLTKTYNLNWSDILEIKKVKLGDYLIISRQGHVIRIIKKLDPQQLLFKQIASYIPIKSE